MTNFTIGDVISDARAELGDTYEGSYAYPTADMARYVGEAIAELRSLRPATRYDLTSGKIQDDDDRWVALTDADIALYAPVGARYRRTLAAYVVFRCMSRDETDKGNLERAGVAYKRFTDTAAL